jgi:hypothetical protein
LDVVLRVTRYLEDIFENEKVLGENRVYKSKIKKTIMKVTSMKRTVLGEKEEGSWFTLILLMTLKLTLITTLSHQFASLVISVDQ